MIQKLVQFNDTNGIRVYVNPNQVKYLREQSPKETCIVFSEENKLFVNLGVVDVAFRLEA